MLQDFPYVCQSSFQVFVEPEGPKEGNERFRDWSDHVSLRDPNKNVLAVHQPGCRIRNEQGHDLMKLASS